MTSLAQLRVRHNRREAQSQTAVLISPNVRSQIPAAPVDMGIQRPGARVKPTFEKCSALTISLPELGKALQASHIIYYLTTALIQGFIAGLQ